MDQNHHLNFFLSPNKWWFIPSIWLVTNVYFLLSLPYGTLHEAVPLISKQYRDGTTQSRSWREYINKTHGIYGSVSWIHEIVGQAKLLIIYPLKWNVHEQQNVTGMRQIAMPHLITTGLSLFWLSPIKTLYIFLYIYITNVFLHINNFNLFTNKVYGM